MDPLTRADVLGFARLQYGLVVRRALSTVGAEHLDYVERLAASWDQELARLAGIGARITARPEIVDAVLNLVRKVSTAEVHEATILGWVDAFPDAVAEMFPPSASTFRIADTAPRGDTEGELAAAA